MKGSNVSKSAPRISNLEELVFLTNSSADSIVDEKFVSSQSNFSYQLLESGYHPLIEQERNLIGEDVATIKVKNGNDLVLNLGTTVLYKNKKHHFLMQYASRDDEKGLASSLEELNSLVNEPCEALAKKVNGVVFWSSEPSDTFSLDGDTVINVYCYGVLVPFDELTITHNNLAEWKAELEGFIL
ncbi:hypothetical protein KW882_05560 [Vibrio parahaemolyticus]